jgi:hypothetical protein
MVETGDLGHGGQAKDGLAQSRMILGAAVSGQKGSIGLIEPGTLGLHVSSHSHCLLYDSHSCALLRLACACLVTVSCQIYCTPSSGTAGWQV